MGGEDDAVGISRRNGVAASCGMTQPQHVHGELASAKGSQDVPYRVLLIGMVVEADDLPERSFGWIKRVVGMKGVGGRAG